VKEEFLTLQQDYENQKQELTLTTETAQKFEKHVQLLREEMSSE